MAGWSLDACRRCWTLTLSWRIDRMQIGQRHDGERTVKTWLSWSSGKDSAWSLHALRQSGEVEVTGLFTTVNAAFGRVAMHAVRRPLVEAQALAAGLPLRVVDIPWPCANAEYERIMGAFVAEARGEGVEAMAFGDLFLADIRAYRERRLAGTGIAPLFPLRGRDTGALAREMIDGGLVAHVTCVDPAKVDRSLAGRRFDHALLADLPPGADPCGENGELHTFVSAGPMLRTPIAVHAGDIIERDGFVFADLLPG
jgi:diphthamide synthase (EF-2-diphthine--ammonia ligase)